MAVVKINGEQLSFSLADFDTLACNAGAVLGKHLFKSELQPLRDLLGQATTGKGKAIIGAIKNMSWEKRLKYAAVIDYVAFRYPDLIDDESVKNMPDPRTGMTFHAIYATMHSGDFMDLVYGLATTRGGGPYLHDRTRYCDAFNKSAGIGDGVAFGRNLTLGLGELDRPAAAVVTAIRDTAAMPGLKFKVTQETRQVYVNGLMASRLNPVTALEMNRARIRKDRNKTPEQIQTWSGLLPGDAQLQDHMWAHARVIKGIRRACKGGIAMVASAAGYRAVSARIHFVLDGLGDLGALAFKQPHVSTSSFLAVTTSELAFCHRYWRDPAFPLCAIVNFYVNGENVRAPWESDWRMNDAGGREVVSNQEAWLRYALARSLRSIAKPFPAF